MELPSAPSSDGVAGVFIFYYGEIVIAPSTLLEVDTLLTASSTHSVFKYT